MEGESFRKSIGRANILIKLVREHGELKLVDIMRLFKCSWSTAYLYAKMASQLADDIEYARHKLYLKPEYREATEKKEQSKEEAIEKAKEELKEFFKKRGIDFELDEKEKVVISD